MEDHASFPKSRKAHAKELMRNLQDSPKQVKELIKKEPNSSLLVDKENGIEILNESLMKLKELGKVEDPENVVPTSKSPFSC